LLGLVVLQAVVSLVILILFPQVYVLGSQAMAYQVVVFQAMAALLGGKVVLHLRVATGVAVAAALVDMLALGVQADAEPPNPQQVYPVVVVAVVAVATL
jgi:hypothetical protein